MKYNRAFIIRNQNSKPLLDHYYSGSEGEDHWLFESKESFHGEHDDEYFYFKDSRLPVMSLSLDYVELEFSEEKQEIWDLRDKVNELEMENIKLKEKLKDFEEYGLRADLNPTQPIGNWEEVTVFFLNYLKRINDSVKERAKID